MKRFFAFLMAFMLSASPALATSSHDDNGSATSNATATSNPVVNANPRAESESNSSSRSDADAEATAAAVALSNAAASAHQSQLQLQAAEANAVNKGVSNQSITKIKQDFNLSIEGDTQKLQAPNTSLSLGQAQEGAAASFPGGSASFGSVSRFTQLRDLAVVKLEAAKAGNLDVIARELDQMRLETKPKGFLGVIEGFNPLFGIGYVRMPNQLSSEKEARIQVQEQKGPSKLAKRERKDTEIKPSDNQGVFPKGIQKS